MCGLAAILRLDGAPADPADLRRMCSAVAHRGPDEASYARLGRGRVGLGHVRLSVVDLEGGTQPLFNEDRTIAVICNGEIYDYAEHRRALERAGHVFATRSDSELLVHLYEEHGDDAWARLNGEFAFVLWDGNRDRLVAVKDPFGIKPLFYRATGDEVLFCSEAKGILALDRVERALCPRYLAGSALGICPPAASAFRGISCLRPSHCLVVDRAGPRAERAYAEPAYDIDPTLDLAAAAGEVGRLFVAAVARRTVADVSVHSYLSGGLDSALVSARLGAGTAYHASFPDSPYDEEPSARAAAGACGQTLDVVPCTDERLAAAVERTVWHTESPLFNTNSVAKLLLSERVRARGHKVCLTGEGADEIFLGYPYVKLETLWGRMREGGAARREAKRLRRVFRKQEALSAGILWRHRWPRGRAVRAYGYPSYLYLRALYIDGHSRSFLRVGHLGLDRGDLPAAAFRRAYPPDRLRALHPLNATREMALPMLAQIVLPLLGDRVEMANGVECRTPMLDRDLVHFARRIPPELLVDIANLREKNPLREAAAELLPEGLRRQSKRPFLAPSWRRVLETPSGRALAGRHLSREAVSRVGVFRRPFFVVYRTLWRALRRGGMRAELDTLMGTVLGVHLLHELFVERRVPSDPEFPLADRTPPGSG